MGVAVRVGVVVRVGVRVGEGTFVGVRVRVGVPVGVKVLVGVGEGGVGRGVNVGGTGPGPTRTMSCCKGPRLPAVSRKRTLNTRLTRRQLESSWQLEAELHLRAVAEKRG